MAWGQGGLGVRRELGGGETVEKGWGCDEHFL